MKKKLLHFKVIMSILLIISMGNSIEIYASYAEVLGHDAGIVGNPLLKAGTYEYDEVCFLSGEPVVLAGTVTVPTTAPATNLLKYTTTYSYDLSNVAKGIYLNRKATFQVDVVKDDALNQTTQNYTLTKLDEKYTVGATAYTLARFTYNQSVLTDNTPAVDYFNGNLYAERVFYKNGTALKNDGVLNIVSNAGTMVGYSHKWGSSETRIINQNLSYVPTSSSTVAASSWSGSVRIEMASQNKKSFKFITNGPQSISFRGSYIQLENQENVLKYTYDLPSISGGLINDLIRNRGTKNSQKSVVVNSSSLVAPKIKDIGGHWAEKDIYLMCSLKIFDEYDRVGSVPGYFSPNVAITRMEFAKAIACAIGNVKPLTKDEIIKRDRPGFVKTFSYQDVDYKDPNASYIEFLNEKHVMIGEGQYFYPNRPITKSEAITMMISALGLSELAPQRPFKTTYSDDSSIPDWAKDYVYVANEINLGLPAKDKLFKPNALVSRGEAATLINGMISHIREKITTDYREKIIN